MICNSKQSKLCGRSKKDCETCWNRSFACNDKSEYWSSKNKLKPGQVIKGTTRKYLFDCNLCCHQFEKKLVFIIQKKSWCPYCSNPPQKLCENNNCKLCFNKSFASHSKSKYWSSLNKLFPRNVFIGTQTKYLFDCNVCNHHFECCPNNISSNNNWCPYCTNQKLCNDNNCLACFNKSFASHDKSKYWSKKNKSKPREIFLSTNFKYLFECEECDHTINQSPNGIVIKNNWCAYCTNKKLCDDNNCSSCFNRSFASHDKSKYWSNKNKLKPREVSISSGIKVWFNCDICKNNFESRLNNVSCHNRWCPFCKNKTEDKLYTWLKENYNYEIKYQPRYDWCHNSETNCYLPFDFSIEELRLIIELDGDQHFKQISNWKNHNDTRKLDVYKMIYALANNYTVIRLLQIDVYSDKNNWNIELNKVIKYYEKAQIITICNDNEYELHLSDLEKLSS